MAYGVGVVTLYVAVESLRRRDGAFPAQPGHWMLLMGLAAALLDGVMTLAVRGSVKAGWIEPWEEWYLIQTFGFAVASAVILAILLRARMELRWRLVWLVVLLLAVSRSALWMYAWGSFHLGWRALPALNVFGPYTLPARVEIAWMTLGAVALVAAIAGDARSGIRRDWLHAAGIAVWTIMAAAELVNCLSW
jgi:hypothetical protein